MTPYRSAALVVAVAAFFQIGCSGPKSTSEIQSRKLSENSSSEIVDEEITQTIANEMKKKCGTLFADKSHHNERCSQAASHMARLLDFNYVRNNSGQSAFVFMSSKLKKMLDDEQVIKFIVNLQSASEDALYLDKPLNVWEFALASSKMSTELATERLAVLIQDGAETAAQIKYLFVIRHPQAMQLYSTVQALEAALRAGKAIAYPASLNNTRTALYHYYVPRYLAQELKRTKVGSDMAGLLPFMFNASYELHQIQKIENPTLALNHKPVSSTEDLSPELNRLLEKWNKYDALYSDLLDHLGAPFLAYDHTRQSLNNDDIYLGYAGAISGVQLNAIPKPQTEFINTFSQDPSFFMRNKGLEL